MLRIRRSRIISGILLLSLSAFCALAQNTPEAKPQTELRDGQHDWDPLFGTWKMHLHRQLHPLTGSNEWADFISHDNTRKVWGGRANLDELEAEGPAGHIEGLALRLYDPQFRQWRIYWANSADPVVENPMIGRYKNSHEGEFYDQELYHGQAIYVRFHWTNVSQNSGDFEQAFSTDGGKSWEPNWITTMSREDPPPVAESIPDHHDGQHDFDFEFGNWKAHLKRLVHPLSGSNEWVEYDGDSVVNKLWNGRGNLGELDVKGPGGHLEGLSLRLFDPTTHLWSLYWANAEKGILTMPPMVGGFKNGRGEFYDEETFEGKVVFVRFIFADITPTSFRVEQAFSADGAKTWKPNWITTFTRVKD